MNSYLKILIQSVLIGVIGVYGIDYFSHLFFSDPMETIPYFLAKMVWYIIFSIFFLTFIDSKKYEFRKVLIAGIIVASIWGMYYNVFPYFMDHFFNIDFYPFGIPLIGLTFLGMGLFGTGVAFGIVHTVAFIGGYYSSQFILKKF